MQHKAIAVARQSIAVICKRDRAAEGIATGAQLGVAQSGQTQLCLVQGLLAVVCDNQGRLAGKQELQSGLPGAVSRQACTQVAVCGLFGCCLLSHRMTLQIVSCSRQGTQGTPAFKHIAKSGGWEAMCEDWYKLRSKPRRIVAPPGPLQLVRDLHSSSQRVNK